MTDIEISKALALAIGWNKEDVVVEKHHDYLQVRVYCFPQWRLFDYRDWNVIGPIAQRFCCFPEKYYEGWYSWVDGDASAMADTPQKAIALAVIGAEK